MTPLARTLAALTHRQGDRPPVFLLFTLHGARALGLSPREYFSRSEHVVEGQLRLREAFGHDCLYGFFYASLELEAWGGATHFIEDGPPNAADTLLHSVEDIARLEAPRLDHPALQKVLTTLAALKARSGGEVPVLGVVLSPFSMPVMQLGFAAWLELLYAARAAPGGHHARLLARLLALNEAFTVAWGNAQLAAGATAVTYFDPLSSASMTEPELGVDLGLAVAGRVLGQLAGPAAIHLASAPGLSRIGPLLATGAKVISASAEDDLGALKAACAGRAALLGNLNGLKLTQCSVAEAEAAAWAALEVGAPGGGFVLADNHGELPLQVPDAVLHALVATSARWAAARGWHP